MDSENYCEIVKKSLSGEKPVGEETFVSLTVLAERLERLKKLGKRFSKVSFSSEIRELAAQESPLAIS